MAYGNGYNRGGGGYNRGNGGNRSYGGGGGYGRGGGNGGYSRGNGGGRRGGSGGGYNNRDSGNGDYDNSNRAGLWAFTPGCSVQANGKPTVKGRGARNGQELAVSGWANLPKDRGLAQDIMNILVEWQEALAAENGGRSKPLFGLVFDDGGEEGEEAAPRRSRRSAPEPEHEAEEEAPAPKAKKSTKKSPIDNPNDDEEIPF